MNYNGIFHLTQSHPTKPIGNAICFPHAGGHGRSYELFAKYMTGVLDIWSIEPPGHLHTLGELIEDIDELCKIYLKILPKDLLRDGLILVGHSLGAYIACSLASHLVAENNIHPTLILCASLPPHLRTKDQKLSKLSVEDLIAFLISIKSLPDTYKDNPELIDFFQKPLRADFCMYESFQFPQNISHLKTFILSGYQDKLCIPNQVFNWHKYFQNINIDFLSGQHLFLNEAKHAKRMAALINLFLNNTYNKLYNH